MYKLPEAILQRIKAEANFFFPENQEAYIQAAESWATMIGPFAEWFLSNKTSDTVTDMDLLKFFELEPHELDGLE